MTERPLLVVAIGGNALLHRGEEPTIDRQRANVAIAAAALAELATDHDLVVTHGNGPQVGLLAAQSEGTPFDVLVAESEGQIGALLAEELGRLLGRDRVVVVLTRVLVDRDDPAFSHPSKPIGSMLTAADADAARATCGWSVMPDGDGWRRCVPSPDPLEVVEAGAVAALVDAGYVVVCAGGGGIPVARADDGAVRGVEAVIDKDLTSALLAIELDADALVILTDVDAVRADFGTDWERSIDETSPVELRSATWAAGSMGPKIEAVCRFVERTGRAARIGALDHAADVAAGRSGTTVR